MKIICDSCGTKYSIADEKVKGKVFKIRCKKCQHIIVVRGTSDDGPVDQGDAGQQPGAGGGDFGDTPVWHVVIDREQVGPMTVAEVRDRFSGGEINADTYIWREGFADWVRLSTVDDFADLDGGGGAGAGVAAAAPAAAGAWGDAAAAQPASGGDAGWGADDAWGAGAGAGAGAGGMAVGAGGVDAGGGDAAGGGGAFGGLGDQEGGALGAGGIGAVGGGGAFSGLGDAGGGGSDADQGAFGAGDQGAAMGGGDLFGAAAPQPAADPGGVFAAPAADPFSAPAPEPAAPAGGGDLFGGGGGGGGQQLFPDDGEQQAAAGQPEGEGDGDVQMTGQRGENSVLFSLSNLQHLAMGSKPTAASTISSPTNGAKDGAGSGLIDIRGMAASTAPASSTAGGDEDLPALGGFSAPVAAAPVLMPAVADERPKWLLPTIIGGGSLLLIAITVLVVVLLTKEDPPVVTPPAGALAGAGVTNPETGTAAKQADEAKTGATEKAATTGDKGDEGKADEGKGAKAVKSGKASRRTRRKSGRRRSSRRRPSARASRDEPTSPPRKSRGKRGKRGKRDALDDLIDGALGGGRRKPKRARAARAAAPAASSNLPESLSRSQIQGGMRRIKGRVQRCYDKFKVPGLANVQIKIGRNGRVGSARIKGIFSGTPTGACVVSAIRSASFPRFKGSPITITYPFVLR